MLTLTKYIKINYYFTIKTNTTNNTNFNQIYVRKQKLKATTKKNKKVRLR